MKKGIHILRHTSFNYESADIIQLKQHSLRQMQLAPMRGGLINVTEYQPIVWYRFFVVIVLPMTILKTPEEGAYLSHLHVSFTSVCAGYYQF